MRVNIFDDSALAEVSPLALSAYVRSEGWVHSRTYGEHADVFSGENRPEILVPRTQRSSDYPRLVSQLIDIFAQAANADELSIYRLLTIADRDVIRIRVFDTGSDDTVSVEEGLNLVRNSKELVAAAAASLQHHRPVYRPGRQRDVVELLQKVRMGQTEQGSYVITMLSPVIAPPMQPTLLPNTPHDAEDPFQRQVTRRLIQGVRAASEAAETADADAFANGLAKGISANLCEALAEIIAPFPRVDVSLSWARTRPLSEARSIVKFSEDNVPVLREAARYFRDVLPIDDVVLYGTVSALKQGNDAGGIMTMLSTLYDRPISARASLDEAQHSIAIDAYERRALVKAEGDLERRGSRWFLKRPRLHIVNFDEDNDGGKEQ